MTFVVESAQSDQVLPEVVEEVDSVESNLKVRPRRRRQQQVDSAPVGKKPQPPPTRSSPSTPVPAQLLPEMTKEELQEPKEPEKVRLMRGFSTSASSGHW